MVKHGLAALVALAYCHSALSGDLDVLLKKALQARDSAAHYFSLAAKEVETPQDSLDFIFHKTNHFYFAWDYDSTMYYGQLFLNHPLGKSDLYRLIFINRYISKRLIDRGRYEEALAYAQAGLKHAMEIADINEISFQYCDISIIYHDFEDFAKGVEYGKIAYRILDGEPKANPIYKAYALNDIAINFDDWGMLDSALYYHLKIFEFAHELDTFEIGFTYNNIANTLIKMNRDAEALPFLKTAVKISKQKSNMYRLATNYTNLATVSYKTGKYKNAELYFDSADHYAAITASVEKWRDIYEEKYKYYKLVGNFEEAMTNQDKYFQLRDSIFKADRARSLAEMETKYQTAIKDQQLADSELEIVSKQAVLQKTVFVAIVLLWVYDKMQIGYI